MTTMMSALVISYVTKITLTVLHPLHWMLSVALYHVSQVLNVNLIHPLVSVKMGDVMVSRLQNKRSY